MIANLNTMSDTTGLKKGINKKDEMALFEELFDTYFRPLATYAYRYVNDWQTAEDITQDVFMSLWINKDAIYFDEPIRPYLYRSIYNKAVNHLNSALIRTRIDRTETIDELINREILNYNQFDTLLQKEIIEQITVCVNALPPQCKNVFLLSREANLKNKEIAERLSISEKAVEKHITKALNEIRDHLVRLEMMPILIGLLVERW